MLVRGVKSSSARVFSHLCQQPGGSPPTVRSNEPFQEASEEEGRRIYYAEPVGLHSLPIHLQQKTPGRISSSGFMTGVLYSFGPLPAVACENMAPPVSAMQHMVR